MVKCPVAGPRSMLVDDASGRATGLDEFFNPLSASTSVSDDCDSAEKARESIAKLQDSPLAMYVVLQTDGILTEHLM